MAIRVLTLILLYSTVASADTAEPTIGIGDTLTVEVYKEPDLNIKATIDQSQSIKMPLVGQISAVGKKPSELADAIESMLYDGYLVNPNVTVSIVEYRPFFIKGAVNNSGRYSFVIDLTVEQAIAISGGLTDRASSQNWYITREKNSQRERVSSDSQVYPGDIVEIEESLF